MSNDQKDTIVELARVMFTTEGIRSVRMDDIAHRAGISKRTLYELFGDKEELIYLAIYRHFELFDEANHQIGVKAPNMIVAFLDVIHNVIDHSELNWRLLNTLTRYHAPVHTRIHEARHSIHLNSFKKGLQEAVAVGLLNSDANLDLAIMMINTIVESVIMESHRQPLRLDISPQEALYQIFVYVLRGIATPRGIEIIDNYTRQNR